MFFKKQLCVCVCVCVCVFSALATFSPTLPPDMCIQDSWQMVQEHSAAVKKETTTHPRQQLPAVYF